MLDIEGILFALKIAKDFADKHGDTVLKLLLTTVQVDLQ